MRGLDEEDMVTIGFGGCPLSSLSFPSPCFVSFLKLSCSQISSSRIVPSLSTNRFAFLMRNSAVLHDLQGISALC